MPAIADIKVSGIIDTTVALKTTSTTVGVDRTLSPDGFQTPGVARWVDRSGGIAIGYPSFSLSVRPPRKGSRIHRVTARLVNPVLEVTYPSTSTGIPPSPTVAYSNQAHLEFLLHERSTQAERIVLLNNLISLLMATITASDGSPSDNTGTPLLAAVKDYDSPY